MQDRCPIAEDDQIIRRSSKRDSGVRCRETYFRQPPIVRWDAEQSRVRCSGQGTFRVSRATSSTGTWKTGAGAWPALAEPVARPEMFADISWRMPSATGNDPAGLDGRPRRSAPLPARKNSRSVDPSLITMQSARADETPEERGERPFHAGPDHTAGAPWEQDILAAQLRSRSERGTHIQTPCSKARHEVDRHTIYQANGRRSSFPAQSKNRMGWPYLWGLRADRQSGQRSTTIPRREPADARSARNSAEWAERLVNGHRIIPARGECRTGSNSLTGSRIGEVRNRRGWSDIDS